jgi:hypothetical protein
MLLLLEKYRCAVGKEEVKDDKSEDGDRHRSRWTWKVGREECRHD